MDRRRDDERFNRLEVRLESHIASCTEINKQADVRHGENLERMDSMNGKLDQLLDAHKVQRAMRRLAVAGWTGVASLAGFAGWAWDHWSAK